MPQAKKMKEKKVMLIGKIKKKSLKTTWDKSSSSSDEVWIKYRASLMFMEIDDVAFSSSSSSEEEKRPSQGGAKGYS